MAGVTRVRIYKEINGEQVDVSDACETANGKSNSSGWSWADILHHSRKIGCIYCGNITVDAPGYSLTKTSEDE